MSETKTSKWAPGQDGMLATMGTKVSMQSKEFRLQTGLDFVSMKGQCDRGIG